MAPPKVLHFITGNTNKLAEVEAILGASVSLQSRSLHLTEIQGTIEEICLDKCRRAAAAIDGPVLVEDTCLCFKALKELPGPYVKWFLEAIGTQGLTNLLAAYEDKSAQAVCTFAYSEGPTHQPVLFDGRTDVMHLPQHASIPAKAAQGKIVSPRGPETFGWDPIFEVDGRTYAEMDKADKNKISHRFKALEKLRYWLEEKE
ncbi:MAG: nucleoside triphosphate pyrophosphohydrolase ham1 [Piccolia ochrophora]|nr:MAG: nucleoside triphosphate pyrophosphohydrolase ham1 [Piccolia ochrophora]